MDGSPRDVIEPSGESSMAPEPVGEDTDDMTTEHSRGDGLGEPNEVDEDVEGEPMDEGKK
jgi:hypothetical protein